MAGGDAAEARSRPAAQDAADRVRRDGRAADQPVGRRLAVRRLDCRTGRGSSPTGERETSPQDLWLLPVPGVAPEDARPRQVTDSLPAVLRDALSPSRVPTAERIAVTARDGLRVEGTLWRPHTATGKRGGTRVPIVVYPHGGPTGAGVPLVPAVQAGPRRGRVRVPRRRLPRLDRLRPGIPHRQPRRVGPRRCPGRHRCRALGRRAAVGGRAPGDLRRVVRRLHGPVRARRGAVAVARRRRPVRRFGDRRELPPRRPARPARPAQDDGLARRRRPRRGRTGAARRSIGRSGSRRRC